MIVYHGLVDFRLSGYAVDTGPVKAVIGEFRHWPPVLSSPLWIDFPSFPVMGRTAFAPILLTAAAQYMFIIASLISFFIISLLCLLTNYLVNKINLNQCTVKSKITHYTTLLLAKMNPINYAVRAMNNLINELPGRLSKDYINSLQILRYDGPITVINRPGQAERLLNSIKEGALTGFDTETRPTFSQGSEPFRIPGADRDPGKRIPHPDQADRHRGFPDTLS
jgi:hypothetical protein